MPNDPMTPAVRFEAVSKTYESGGGKVQALSDITLDIAKGEIFGMIGRSGAGKSSLLRMINRLERPSAGRVLIGGEDIALLDEAGLVTLRRRIGMVFQHFNLMSAMTVRDNVGLPLKVANVPAAEIRTRVDEVLRLVGLEDKGAAFPSRLSGGQKQRVGIARALISRPEILLCDEATSALDPETTLSILALLGDLHKRLGLTVILITHEMSVVREICQRVVVLENGRIAESGPVWQIFGAPSHPATEALLSPLARRLPAGLAERIHPDRAPGDLAVIALEFSGTSIPSLNAIAAACPGAQILGAGLEQIDGHPVGQILLALPERTMAPGQTAPSEPVIPAGLASNTRMFGYVAANV